MQSNDTTPCTKISTVSHQTGYNRGCRCRICKDAHNEYAKSYRQRPHVIEKSRSKRRTPEEREKARKRNQTDAYKEYHRKYSKKYGHQWYLNHRNDSPSRKYLNELREAGCSRCPESDPVCLDFHHVDPETKLFNPSSGRRNIELVRAEVAKCILVCANCHRKIHASLL